MRPEVILLDEPTSALDPISTLKIEELIDELKHDFTIAIVTHNMQQAARCADQVAFFYLGEMVECRRRRRSSPRRSKSARRNTSPAGSAEQGREHDVRSTEHLVKSFDTDLKRLRDMLTAHGRDRGKPGRHGGRGDHRPRRRAATRAVEEDPKVDALEREIEQFVIRMLALRQPMAGDLRHVVAALKITGDLERIGDYAANVAKRSDRSGAVHRALFACRTGAHGALVQEQLKSIIDALGDNDADKAIEVWRSDRVVDDIYNAMFRELITYMMEDPRNITPCTHLLFIAKNLERIGDHATNIAENRLLCGQGRGAPGCSAERRYVRLCCRSDQGIS